MAAKDIYHDHVRKALESFLSQPHVEPLLREENIRLIVFEPKKEEIIKWINWTDTET